jgi:methionyl-tRNA formyltransferase
MRTVLIGAVESTAVTLHALVAGGCAPVGVVGLDASRAGRHSDFVDMGALSAEHGLPFLGVASANSDEAVAWVEALQPDWIIVVGWSEICRAPLLSKARLGGVGYHPAPLPALRGRAVLAWTILLGLTETAGTLFALESTVDSGAILAQRSFPVDAHETLPSLMAKHMQALSEMWADLLPRLARGPVTGEAQDDARATYCARRVAADGRIDWRMDAVSIDRLVRAVTAPYPGAFTALGDRRLIVWQAQVWEGPRHYGLPGQIVEIRGAEALVTCGDGAILFQRWDWAEAGEPRRLRVNDRFEAWA